MSGAVSYRRIVTAEVSAATKTVLRLCMIPLVLPPYQAKKSVRDAGTLSNEEDATAILNIQKHELELPVKYGNNYGCVSHLGKSKLEIDLWPINHNLKLK